MPTHSDKAWTDLHRIHNDLLIAKELVYDKCYLICSQPLAEEQSADYAAYTFTINGLFIKYRSAKTTPTKTGQFVTIWKRGGNGSIEPFNITDSLDFIIVSVRKCDMLGQFIFPKSVLLLKGVISDHNKEGKRGIRVYPPWDHVTNKQAEKTQNWQSEYFVPIAHNSFSHLILVRKLFSV